MSGPVRPPPPRPQGIVSPAKRFRKEIETAMAEGAETADLTLRLTLSDANRLMRDPETPTADIGFHGGQMTYLGVNVERGKVVVSCLILTADLPPEPEPVEPPPKKKKAAPKAKAKAKAE